MGRAVVKLWRPWSFIRIPDGRVVVMRYTAPVGHVRPEGEAFLACIGGVPVARAGNVYRPLRYIVRRVGKEVSDAKALQAAHI